MSIATKLAMIAENEQKVYNAGWGKGLQDGVDQGFQTGVAAGRQEQYDEFWDAFQDNGNRTEYNASFNGSWWNDASFKPKYPIIMKSARQALYSCGASKIPVELDTSQATDLTLFAAVSKFTELPVIDARGVPRTTKISTAIYNCPNLVKVEKVYLHGGDWSDSFMRLQNLVEIRFEGEFVTNINFEYSNKLSRASIESIVAALSDNVTGQTLTFHPTAVNNAFTVDEWETLVATKTNWTIAK